MHESAIESHAPPPPPPGNSFQGVVISVAVAIGVVVILRVVIRKFAAMKANRKLSQTSLKSQQSAAAPQGADTAASETAAPNEQQGSQPEIHEKIGSLVASDRKWSPIERFIEVAPERIEEIRKLFSEVSRTPNEIARQKTLEELCGRIRALRLICDAPELVAVDKLVATLEELFKQASGRSSGLTTSMLRTAAGAIVLLESLCKPGRHLDAIFDPPPRFLTVDDDPICRQAVAASLKKVFGAPDLAEQGQAALLLAAVNRYDAVFLDVEMPGMDGFEVCTKIHQTAANTTTPVVFVTSHSDFDSRAKSAEAGGHDLVGKPFQPLEITVKALTLLIKSRSQFGRPKELPVQKKPRSAQAVQQGSIPQTPTPIASPTAAVAANPAAAGNTGSATPKPDAAPEIGRAHV